MFLRRDLHLAPDFCGCVDLKRAGKLEGAGPSDMLKPDEYVVLLPLHAVPTILVLNPGLLAHRSDICEAYSFRDAVLCDICRRLYRADRLHCFRTQHNLLKTDSVGGAVCGPTLVSEQCVSHLLRL